MSRDSELTDLSDAALVLRFRATRDNLFFTVLYRRHLREVFLRIRQVLREHRVQATDLTQDTFLKAYSNIESYNGGDFRAWLLRIARNECLNYLQSARVRREVITGVASLPARRSSLPRRLVRRPADGRIGRGHVWSPRV